MLTLPRHTFSERHLNSLNKRTGASLTCHPSPLLSFLLALLTSTLSTSTPVFISFLVCYVSLNQCYFCLTDGRLMSVEGFFGAVFFLSLVFHAGPWKWGVLFWHQACRTDVPVGHTAKWDDSNVRFTRLIDFISGLSLFCQVANMRIIREAWLHCGHEGWYFPILLRSLNHRMKTDVSVLKKQKNTKAQFSSEQLN